MTVFSLKREAKDIVKCARVSAYGFTLLFLAISWLLNSLSDFVSLNEELVYNIYYTTGVDLSFLILHRAFPPLLVTFVTVIVALLGVLLGAGYCLYHLGIRRGEEMPYLTLFDGFSFTGKLILLALVRYIFVFLWSMLFIIPGIIAAYRYRFAVYNLCENPEMGVMDAINMSKAQTALRAGSELPRLADPLRPDAGHPLHLDPALPRPDRHRLFPADQGHQRYRLAKHAAP